MKLQHQLRPPCDLEGDDEGIWGAVPPIDARCVATGIYDLAPYDARLFPAGGTARVVIKSPGRQETMAMVPYYRRSRPDGLVRLWMRPAAPSGAEEGHARVDSSSLQPGATHSAGGWRRSDIETGRGTAGRKNTRLKPKVITG